MRFDSYHPAINLIYFAAAISCAVMFTHPVYAGISYAAAFIYSVKLGGRRSLVFDLCLIPCIAGYTAYYSYYRHFGVTVLSHNLIGNSITLESVVYGLQRGVTAATVLMFISCLFAVFSSDKVVYLFGRISPKLSLMLSILLRTVPRVKKRIRITDTARSGIGKGVSQGNLAGRITSAARTMSSVITWLLDSFMDSSVSMRSRGYTLKGRTAFSIYRFDNRDRSFVVVMFICVTMTAAAAILDQTHIYYDPEIVMNRITPASYAFYAAYALMLLLPAGLQTAGGLRFRKTRKNAGHAKKTVSARACDSSRQYI